MTVSKKEGIWEGLLEDSIRHHRPPAIVALTNLVRLVMWTNLKKHVEDEVLLPPLTVSNEIRPRRLPRSRCCTRIATTRCAACWRGAARAQGARRVCR